jgi:putative hydrolase of the HAD superfamily
MQVTLFIDADDTLWFDSRYFRRLEEVIKKSSSRLNIPGYKVRETINKYMDKEPGFGEDRFQRAIKECARQLCDEICIEEVAEACDIFLQHEVELLPGVESALADIDVKKHLVTKGTRKEQLSKIDRSGLISYFDSIHILDSKNINSYQRVINDLSLTTSSIIIIGNSIKHDIIPISTLGGSGIWLNHFENHFGRNGVLPDGVVEVESWSGILKTMIEEP